MVVRDFMECFGVNILGDENAVNRNICRYCKQKLAAAMQLKRAVMSGLDGSTQMSESLVHSMGASPLVSTRKSCPVPHVVPTECEHQYHRQKMSVMSLVRCCSKAVRRPCQASLTVAHLPKRVSYSIASVWCFVQADSKADHCNPCVSGSHRDWTVGGDSWNIWQNCAV